MRPNNILLFILAALIVILSALITQRSHQSNTFMESSLNGGKLPEFHLPSLTDPERSVSDQTLHGRVFLLNFWASWCGACMAEHATFMRIAKQYHIPIFGIAYKDTPENAKNWLNHFGNPFTVTAMDNDGSLQQKFQMYGLPQTFVVDKKGLIRLEFMGTMDEDFWIKTVWPKIQEYELEP